LAIPRKGENLKRNPEPFTETNVATKNQKQHCVALASGLTKKPLIFQPNADCSSTRPVARLAVLSEQATAVSRCRTG
jgi:hypothetical protein